MRRRLLFWLVPVLLAGSATLIAPSDSRAAGDGLTETGTTTYELRPDHGLFHVTIVLTLKNSLRSTSTSCENGAAICTTRYYWNRTEVAVENEAGKVTATSNAGRVTQAVRTSDHYYRYLTLTFPNLYYGQTRVVTVSYDIPGTPRSSSAFRAGQAYANLCAIGNGRDSGSVNVVLPERYAVDASSLSGLSPGPSSATTRTLTSGTISSPYEFWSCLEASDDDAFVGSTLSAAGETFSIEAWPEDTTWAQRVSADVSGDVGRLEDLLGLPLPDATITVREAASLQLGDYVGLYDASDRTATVAEEADPATVAHELSHIWFNRQLFMDIWASEGFAVFAEQAAGPGNYEACTEPGSYPGTGPADLTHWLLLDNDATAQDEATASWQYQAACYLITTVADEIGPARLKDVLAAAADGQIAYLGAPPAEPSPLAGPPVGARALLDLVDELGMVPAGVPNLDEAQSLFADDGILPGRADQEARSAARAAYHALQKAAGWQLPIAIRNPMASWKFDAAEQAMSTARDILAARDEIARLDPSLSLDPLRIRFESAADQPALDALLAFARNEAGAAGTVRSARQASAAGRSILDSIGLLGSDLPAQVEQATSALAAGRPDEARSTAEALLTGLSTAGDRGLQRVALSIGGLLGAALLAIVLVLLLRGRRRRVVVVAEPALVAFDLQSPEPPPSLLATAGSTDEPMLPLGPPPATLDQPPAATPSDPDEDPRRT